MWRKRANRSKEPSRVVEPCGADIRTELEQRGVAADFAESLAEKLELQLSRCDPAALEAALDAVGMAYSEENRAQTELSRSVRELQEVERLMGNFVGELSKLDEALEVLAAYVRRMRTHSSVGGERARMLH